MLLCPSFFDSRRDGIGRVSGAFHDAMSARYKSPPVVWSANDPASSEGSLSGRCFARNYPRMLLAAFFARLSPQEMRPPVLAMHLGLSPVARILARRVRRPYAVFLHGVECWRPLRSRSRWGMQRAKFLFFNSFYTRETFFRCNPWAADHRNLVVPLGIPIPLLESTGRSGPAFTRDTAGKPLRILCVGRMSKAEFYKGFRDGGDLYKGFKLLILASGKVASQGIPVKLEIVGDGDARPELEAWLKERPEARHVTLLGRVSDERLAQAYRENDVFSLPSEGEGFGLVFAEAMAQGLPSVCVAAGAAPEVVTHELTGLVARPRDVDDLAEKFVRLARDPALRCRLGAAGLDRYHNFYAYGKFLERINSALTELESA